MESKKVINITDKEILNKQYKYAGIENLEIEEGVETIGEEAFSNNKITKLKLPKSIKKVGDYAFAFNKVKELTFYNTGIKFGLKCFCCTKECYYGYVNECCQGDIVYEDYSPISKVTIIDGNYKSFIDIIDCIFPDLFEIINGYNIFRFVREINIVNDNISLDDIKKISESALKHPNIKVNIFRNNTLIFTNQTLSVYGEQTNDETIDIENLDVNVIKKKLDEIENKIKNLDPNTKKSIVDEVKLLIKEYQSQLQCLKPQLKSKISVDLNFDFNSFESLDQKLINSLDQIINNLNKKESVLSLSEKINKYQSILQGKEIIGNDDKLKKIKTIVELSEYLNDFKFLNRLCFLLDKIQVAITNNLKDNDTFISKNNDLESLLKKLEEMFIYIDKLIPYFELLKCFDKVGTSELTNEIKEIDIVLSNFNSDLKDEISQKISILKNKYRCIIKDNIKRIVNNKNDIMAAREIELNFRKELHPILVIMQTKIYSCIKVKDLERQILLADKLLHGECIKEKGEIIDLINDITTLANNLELGIDEKCLISDKIDNMLKSIIAHWINTLNTKDISDIVKQFDSEINLKNENLIIEIMIMRELYELKFFLENYAKETKEYNSKVKFLTLFSY